MPCPEDSVLRSLESYVARMGPPSLRPEDLGCLTSAAPSQYEMREATPAPARSDKKIPAELGLGGNVKLGIYISCRTEPGLHLSFYDHIAAQWSDIRPSKLQQWPYRRFQQSQNS